HRRTSLIKPATRGRRMQIGFPLIAPPGDQGNPNCAGADSLTIDGPRSSLHNGRISLNVWQMPETILLYRVLFAAPDDVTDELSVAEELVDQWNVQHGQRRRTRL